MTSRGTAAAAAAKSFLAAWAILAVSGCATERRPAAPFVWIERGPAAFEAATPPTQRRGSIEVLYLTDRVAEGVDAAGPVYGYGRSRSVGYGVAEVGYDPPETWASLRERATTLVDPRDATPPPEPVVLARRETARFGRAPADLEIRDGRLVPTEPTLERERAAQAVLEAELERRLAAADRRDVYVFVHGFNNTFDEAVIRLAELWHAMGRPGVALAHAWPAGYGGVLGYTYDRESGEFTVRHLKNLLLFLAASPAVERVHVVAHSRGTDVAVTALRELHLVARARGEDSRASLKLATLVLAAPDLDTDVFDQRFVKEALYEAAGRTTIYFNPGDSAIGLAKWLFSSRRRVGDFHIEDLEVEVRDHLARLPHVEFVQCDLAGRAGAHDYVFKDPSALSDVVLLLREGARAGSASRPLDAPEPGLWRMTNAYLAPSERAAASRVAPRPPSRRLDY